MSIMPSVAMNGGMPSTEMLNAVDEADQAAEQDRRRATPAQSGQPQVGEEDAGHHAAEDHAGADRQVDAAGDDDERRAEGEDAGHGRRGEDRRRGCSAVKKCGLANEKNTTIDDEARERRAAAAAIRAAARSGTALIDGGVRLVRVEPVVVGRVVVVIMRSFLQR